MSVLITLPVVSTVPTAPVVLREPHVETAPAAPVSVLFESCGRAFHAAALGAEAVHEATSEVEITAGGLNLKDEKWEVLRNKRIDLDDYYALLGLEDKSWRATVDEIKNAFRIVSLVCHPDKASPDQREYAEARFKALQKGYETLIDPTKRRGYDSSLPFDDALPGEKQGVSEETFFKVYAPVFARNERFSTIQPVPQLGDMNTPDEKVFSFYDFWFNFKSWREYAHLDEHKINDGTGREEKRWMLRENQKKQAGKKKEELARIRKLAEDAQKKDPRIARLRKREEEEKQKKKLAKNQGSRAQAEAAAAAAKAKAEEEARLVAEEKRKKEKPENAERDQKKQLKSIRSYFGTFCRAAGLPEEDVEKLKGVLGIEEFTAVVEEFRADKDSAKGKEMFQAHLEHFFKDEVEARKSAPPKPAAAPASAAPKAQAPKEKAKETESKTKTKGGDAASTKAAPAASTKAAPAASTKAAAPATSSSPPSSSGAGAADSAAPVEWTQEEQERLEAALRKIGKEVEDRWGLIAAEVKTKDKKQCQSRFKKIRDQVVKEKGAEAQ